MAEELPEQSFRVRMKMLVDHVGGVEKLAKLANMSSRVISKYLAGDSDPSRERLVALATAGKVNTAWLVAGEGPMKVQGGFEAGRAIEHKAIQGFEPVEGVTLQVYFAGGAGDPFELVPSEPIEEIVIPKAFYTPSIVPVKVQGRSMSPTMRDGAIVGVDRADRRIVNGELYAVWLPYQGAVIKRLYLDAKKILLQSDNEEFRSHDIEVDLEELDEHFVQGRVKWVMQML